MDRLTTGKHGGLRGRFVVTELQQTERFKSSLDMRISDASDSGTHKKNRVGKAVGRMLPILDRLFREQNFKSQICYGRYFLSVWGE